MEVDVEADVGVLEPEYEPLPGTRNVSGIGCDKAAEASAMAAMPCMAQGRSGRIGALGSPCCMATLCCPPSGLGPSSLSELLSLSELSPISSSFLCSASSHHASAVFLCPSGSNSALS
jgi:hypothetical protein